MTSAANEYRHLVRAGRATLRLALAALAMAIMLGGVSLAQQSANDPATRGLFEAVHNNDLASVQASIAAGADIKSYNKWGLTATDLAIEKGYFNIAHYLLSVRHTRPGTDAGTVFDGAPPKDARAAAETPLPKVAASPPAAVAKNPLPAVAEEPPATAPREPASPAPPAWPANRPNPFDPNAVAPGSSIEVIGKLRGSPPPPAAPAPVVAMPPLPAAPPVRPEARKTAENATRPPSEASVPLAEAPAAAPGPSSPPPRKPSFFNRKTDFFRPGKEEVGKPPEAPPPPAPVVAAEKLPPPPAPVVATEDLVPPSSPAVAETPKPAKALPAARPPEPQPGLAVPVGKIPDRPEPAPARAAVAMEEQATPESGQSPGIFERIADFFFPEQPGPPESAVPPAIPEKAQAPLVEAKPPPQPTETAQAPKFPPPRPAEAAPPMATQLPGKPEGHGFFQTLIDFLSFGEEAPDVKPTPEAPAERVAAPSAGKQGAWTVQNVETAQIPPPLPAKPRPGEPSGRNLKGAMLTLGQTVRLGQVSGVRTRSPGEPRACVEKKQGTILFCIEPVDWPVEMRPYLHVNSIMYQGTKAIVRYDDGTATYLHALFPSQSFEAIVGYYERRFGSPTASLKRSIAPLAAPRRENPTVMWQSTNPVTNEVTTLEVRMFDDSRGSFPDTRRGAILLYHEWSTSIFPQLSTLELLLLRSDEKTR